MPSIAENLVWGTYSWPQQGAEWSAEWGDAETQWHAMILPRIRSFLPAKNILEIAPGYGRWSGFLMNASDKYTGIDLNPECINACQKRFAGARNAEFAVNDGKSLDAVADSSIDFAFSFDSLVHVEFEVMEAYLSELSRKLSPNGIAFLHHSNLGEYVKSELTLKVLRRLQLNSWMHWRAPSVTAKKVADIGAANGLPCISQEIMNWGPDNRRLIDCFSTFTRPGSKWEHLTFRIRNPYFMSEARSARVISEISKSLPLGS